MSDNEPKPTTYKTANDHHELWSASVGESSFAAPAGLEAGLCECAHWARSINPKYLTNHHENCQHYNDSLMVVWKVSDGSSSFYVENEQDARHEMAGCEDLTISQVKIHREVFEHLPEFEGF